MASALVAGGLLFACAGTEVEVDDNPITSADASAEAAPKPSATTPPRDAAPPKVCSTTCTQDSDCETTCPAGGGAACCDTSTKVCFRSTGATCPVPQAPFDAATPPGPY